MSFSTVFEPPHDKTKKVACAPSKDRSAWAFAQSDQSSLCALWVAQDSNFLQADSDDLSLCLERRSFCWFCHEAAHFSTVMMVMSMNRSV